MSSDRNLPITRRAFATGMTGSLAALGINGARAAPTNKGDASDAEDLRDAALRWLARVDEYDDPVLEAKAYRAIERLRRDDPESAALVEIYRLFDMTYGYSGGHHDEETVAMTDLAVVHEAVRDHRALWFRYFDRHNRQTVRTVLPLALVHPPRGIMLLAWCEKREDYRQFYVRRMQALTPLEESFAQRRLELLQGFLEYAYDQD